MKKTIFILLLIVVFSVSSIYGASVGKTTAITVNPIGFLFGVFNAQLDLGVGSSMSLVLGGSYWSLDLTPWKYTSMSISGGMRYYWQGDAVHGWYINPLVNLNIVTVTYTDPITAVEASGNATAIGFGGMVGYQSIWDSGVVFDFGLGYQLATIPSVSVDVGGTTHDSGSYSYGSPLIQLAIGYAF